MSEFFEEVIGFLTKLFPLIVILSMMGLGNSRKKKEQAKKQSKRPAQSRPAPRPTQPAIDPLEEAPQPLEMFAQLEPLVLPPSRPESAPHPESAPAASPSRPRVDPATAYAITAAETQHAYDIDTDAYSGAWPVSKQTSGLPSAAQLMRSEPWDRDSLRRGVLLREILGRPIALRDESNRFW